MELIDKISNFCDKETSLYGFANIQNYQDHIIDNLKGYSYAISIGISIPDEIVDNITPVDGEVKYRQAYNQINNKLNEITNFIEQLIIDNGFDAKAVNASYILPDSNLSGELSHKMIANLAGLGWIGKSCLLITPTYGPRVRWATVLTNLELNTPNKKIESQCGNCRLCIVNCPSDSFKDVKFNENEPRDVRYDANKCSEYFDKLESMGRPRLCGLCVKVCPWGLVNKKSRKNDNIIKINN